QGKEKGQSSSGPDAHLCLGRSCSHACLPRPAPDPDDPGPGRGPGSGVQGSRGGHQAGRRPRLFTNSRRVPPQEFSLRYSVEMGEIAERLTALSVKGITMAEAIDPRWAWERYRPGPKAPWDVQKVGHLYRRAAFGATYTQLDAGLKAGPDKTIDLLLKGGSGQEAFEKLMAPLAQSLVRVNSGNQARAWWLYRMLYTPHPLREKMTLFWHNHFATSNRKVQNAAYMLGQYQLMYKHALGNFRTLLQEMSKDPAMMVWLDTSQSRKGKPNENYARELMELFSLGIGNYTEQDIREAARAFTGWELTGGKAVFNADRHDDGEKKVLGKTGKFKGEDIVNICLEQKSAPYFVAGKLFRFLISETTAPTPELLEPLASQFRKSGYD